MDQRGVAGRMMSFDEPTLDLLGECYLLLEEYNQQEKITQLRRFGRAWCRLQEVGAQKRAQEIAFHEEEYPERPYTCPRCGQQIPTNTEAHALVRGIPMLACPFDGCLLMNSGTLTDYVPEEV